MADSVVDKTKSNSHNPSVTATPAESHERHVPSGDVTVLKDFIIGCPPEHSTHPALDKLGLVIIVGLTNEGVTAMERTSPTEWRYNGTIELRPEMDELIFVVQAKDFEGLGHVALTKDDLGRFLAVNHNGGISVERRFEPLEPKCPTLWITFTVGMGVLRETHTHGGSALIDVNALLERVVPMDSEHPGIYHAFLWYIGRRAPQHLNTTGDWLIKQFERTGRKADIGRAILAYEQAVQAISAEHPWRAAYIGDCGQALSARFRLSGNLDDAHRAISMLEQSISLSAENDIDLPRRLSLLGNSYESRFRRTGDLADLENAISNQQRAVKLAQHGHAHRPVLLNNLGNAFKSRFDHTGDLADLENAISNLQHAVELTPRGRADMPSLLNNLGRAFRSRFGRTGDFADLENAISNLQRAIKLTPHGHAYMPSFLNNLGSAFESRFGRTGDLADLENAISNKQRAVELTPHGHASMPSWLNNLGNAFESRFGRTRDLADLENAISTLQHAVELTPHGHADMPSLLGNLGRVLHSHFGRTGNLADLENGISNLQRAIDLTPHGRTDMALFLNNLGNAFKSRFGHTGDLADLENAISNLQHALVLTPHGHAEMSSQLNNLGSALHSRFRHTGDLADLESAISNLQHAVELTPHGHASMPSRLNNLGNAFVSHFGRSRDLADLENAISNLQHAVELTPHSHENMPSRFNNLGSAFQSRFDCSGDLADLENAISNFQHAIELTPHGHADMPARLNNLGSAFDSRFRHTSDITDVENAISNLQRAIQLTPHGHAYMPLWLNNLGNAFKSRFRHTKDLTDLENAISSLQRAVELTPHGHADMSSRLGNLGNAFVSYFQYTHKPGDLDQGISAHRSSATHISGAPFLRLRAARTWAGLSQLELSDNTDTLEAYRTAIELLAQVAGLEQTVSKRYTNLGDASDLTMSASAAAIDAGQHETAVEWLEQGRCLVWNQIQQLRTPVEDLRIHSPSLADRFLRVANGLEISGSRETKYITSSDADMSQIIIAQDENKRHVDLAKEWTELLDEIRALPSFSDFLRPPTSSSLFADLPLDGAVVIFNIHKDRCDALALIFGSDAPLHIPLPTFTHRRAVELRDSLGAYLTGQGVRVRDAGGRAGRLFKKPEKDTQESVIHKVLREIWENVVKPILDALAYNNSSKDAYRPRVWWCPTGPLTLLPIHAAGVYTADGDRTGPCVSDFVVSSYTPTISALNSRSKSAAPTADQTPARLLLISQPSTPGLGRIPATVTETRRLKDVMEREHLESSLLNDDVATNAQVTEEMKTHSWVHFACHAIQDKDPLKSGIHLYDGRLELLEMMKQRIPHADHAFLSACQTGTGDRKLSDEVAHIAAGMLAVGYRGVVATMWSISDAHGPEIAQGFYEHILNASGEEVGRRRLDSSRAAYALDASIQKVRERLGDTEEALLTWVPYVHFGL